MVVEGFLGGWFARARGEHVLSSLTRDCGWDGIIKLGNGRPDVVLEAFSGR
jgi:hypothetical protein